MADFVDVLTQIKELIDIPAFFVVVTHILGRPERVNVQHITWVYYDEEADQTVVRFSNGGTRYYEGNAVVALTQDCIVHTA